MSNQIHYTLCPVCGSADISEVFKVKDNTVSQEYFEIYHCRNCQVRFTQNPPSETSIELIINLKITFHILTAQKV
jgi:hypothetical protein